MLESGAGVGEGSEVGLAEGVGSGAGLGDGATGLGEGDGRGTGLGDGVGGFAASIALIEASIPVTVVFRSLATASTAAGSTPVPAACAAASKAVSEVTLARRSVTVEAIAEALVPRTAASVLIAAAAACRSDSSFMICLSFWLIRSIVQNRRSQVLKRFSMRAVSQLKIFCQHLGNKNPSQGGHFFVLK